METASLPLDLWPSCSFNLCLPAPSAATASSFPLAERGLLGQDWLRGKGSAKKSKKKFLHSVTDVTYIACDDRNI
jgi:hypothetical protein